MKMRLKDKIISASSILRVALLKQRIPVAIRFQLTNRCDNRCLYCNIWKTPAEELSTQQVFFLLKQLKEAGTKRISFSGGEPLLRDDIGQIIDYATTLGISCGMNSRGGPNPKKLKELKNLDLLKVSIDGPEEIHDFLSRTRGSYRRAIQAIETARENGIKVTLTTTLTRYNINRLDFILELAKKYDTLVAFQPLKKLYRKVEEFENLYPDTHAYRRAMHRLIVLKKQGNPNMRNSLVGLKHIWQWPQYGKLKCAAGRLFAIMEVNGDLYPCDRREYKVHPNCLKFSFRQSWDRIKPSPCSGCGFCGTLELSFLLSFKFSIILTILNLIS